MSRTLRLSFVLAFNGGYVDTAGFIALRGLFVDHMTGNLILASAALFHNTPGVTAGLLALPVFCLTVMATRLVSAYFGRGDRTDLRPCSASRWPSWRSAASWRSPSRRSPTAMGRRRSGRA